MNVKVALYFKSDLESKDCTIFDMEANSVEEVAQMFLSQKGKQAINLTNGYRIINFDNVCFIDIAADNINNNGGGGDIYEEEEIVLDAQE